MNEYVHFGNTIFIPETLLEKRNVSDRAWLEDFYNRPIGFWGSPVDTDSYTWEWFNKEAELKECSHYNCFKFRIRKGYEILHIHCVEDSVHYLKSIKAEKGMPPELGLDWDKIRRDYAGVEIHDGIGYYEKDSLGSVNIINPFLHWSCDSIVIWEPAAVEGLISPDEMNLIIKNQSIIKGHLQSLINDKHIFESYNVPRKDTELISKINYFDEQLEFKFIDKTMTEEYQCFSEVIVPFQDVIKDKMPGYQLGHILCSAVKAS